MKEIIVAVVRYKSKTLILKRNNKKHFDPRKWEFVSGIINSEQNLKKFAKQQVLIETGLNHPFLFSSESDEVKLKEDHENYQWIEINELDKFDAVHELSKNLNALNL